MAPPVPSPGHDGAEQPATGRPRRLKLLAPLVGLAAAAGVVVALVKSSSDPASRGGSASAEAVVNDLVGALNREDLLAASQLVSPSEAPDLAALTNVAITAAKAQGLNGLQAGDGLDLVLTVKATDVQMLSDDAARISLAGGGTVGGAVEGIVNQLLVDGPATFDLDGVRTDRGDPYVVAVRERGRWFLSPMLTFADYLAADLDLPSGDYRRIAEPLPRSTATTPDSAIEQLLDSISSRDSRRAVPVLAAGEARLLTVFEDAAAELIGRIDSEVAMRIDNVRVAPVETGFAIDSAEISFTTVDDSATVRLDSRGCLRDTSSDSAPGCLLHEMSRFLTKDFTEERPVLMVSQGDGGFVVSLAGSAIHLATEAAQNVSRDVLISGLGINHLDQPLGTMAVGTVQAVDLGKQWYANYDIPLEADTLYSFAVFADDADKALKLDLYDGPTRTASAVDRFESGSNRTIRTDAAGTYRLTVSRDLDCEQRCTVDPATGSVVITKVETVSATPGTPLTTEIPPGGAVLVTFPSSATQRYTVDDPSAVWQDFPATDSDGVVLGTGSPLTFRLSNDTTAVRTASVTITAADQLPKLPERGFEGGNTIIVDLSQGEQSVTLYRLPGDEFSVTARPLDPTLDVILDGVCASGCVADSGGAGASESVFLIANFDESSTIIVRPFSGSGQVELTFALTS